MLGCWDTGMLTNWDTEMLGCWNAEVVECWDAGMLRCWEMRYWDVRARLLTAPLFFTCHILIATAINALDIQAGLASMAASP